MPKVHVLDIYPHSGDKSCVGCVEVSQAEADAAAKNAQGQQTPKKKPAGKARGDTRPVDAVRRTMKPKAKQFLVGAKWGRATAHPGDHVDLGAQALNFDLGAAATIRVRARDSSEVVEEIKTTVNATVISATWVASAIENGVCEFQFEVEVDGETATSDVLKLTDFVDLTLRDTGGAALAGAKVTLLLADGGRAEWTAGEKGHLRLDDVASGDYEVLDVETASGGDEGDPEEGEGGDFDATLQFEPGVTATSGTRVLIEVERVNPAEQALALRQAAETGAPFCEECEKKRRAHEAAGAPA